MNLNDPRNVLMTVSQGFQFDLDEYQKAIGARIKVMELNLSDTDEVVKDVLDYANKEGLKIKVKSWSPLLFDREMKNSGGEPIVETFSLLALRIVGDLNDVNGEIEQRGRLKFLNLPEEEKH